MGVYVDLVLDFLNIFYFKDEAILNAVLVVVYFSTSYFYEKFEYIINENLSVRESILNILRKERQLCEKSVRVVYVY